MTVTRKQSSDPTGTFIAELVLQILSYVAQAERDFIKQRQAEGIASAKASGVHFGRKAMELPQEFDAVRSAYENGKMSLRSAAEALGLSKSTFHRYARTYLQKIHK